MSDADPLEEVVALSLFTLLPKMQADNRTTLIYMVVGLILGRNVQLAKIAEKSITSTKKVVWRIGFGVL